MISNMTMTFSNSNPNYPDKVIFVLNLSILFFHETLLIEKSKEIDFKNDNSFFKFMHKITQMRYFWSQVSGFLILYETLYFDKFEFDDVKYDNSF